MPFKWQVGHWWQRRRPRAPSPVLPVALRSNLITAGSQSRPAIQSRLVQQPVSQHENIKRLQKLCSLMLAYLSPYLNSNEWRTLMSAPKRAMELTQGHGRNDNSFTTPSTLLEDVIVIATNHDVPYKNDDALQQWAATQRLLLALDTLKGLAETPGLSKGEMEAVHKIMQGLGPFVHVCYYRAEAGKIFWPQARYLEDNHVRARQQAPDQAVAEREHCIALNREHNQALENAFAKACSRVSNVEQAEALEHAHRHASRFCEAHAVALEPAHDASSDQTRAADLMRPHAPAHTQIVSPRSHPC